MTDTTLERTDSCCESLCYFLKEKKLPIQYNPRLHRIELQSVANIWVQEINFCPFCGANWQNTLEERWSKEVAKLGLKGGYLELLESVPDRLKTSEWWKQSNREGGV